MSSNVILLLVLVAPFEALARIFAQLCRLYSALCQHQKECLHKGHCYPVQNLPKPQA